MYMLIMVLDDVSHLNDVLVAWEGAGVRGVTILESTGLHRVMLRHRPEAAYARFGRLFGSDYVGHNTLFAVVDSMTVVEAAVAAAEGIVGNLDDPHTGIVFALPVTRAWGLGSSGNTPVVGQEG